MRISLRSITVGLALTVVATACGGSSHASSPDPSAATTTSVAQGVGCRTERSGPTTYRYAERPGVDPDLGSLDVYMPAGCGPVPVVVWVHGGGWIRGDKTTGSVALKAEWAESLGAALVSVNYRLSTEGSGVVWPDHGEDVAAAVAWVQHEGAGIGLDTSRLTLLGHSAGAHLVAIVGTDPSLLIEVGGDPASISCVIPLDSSFDLTTAADRLVIENAFGTDPEVLADASPSVAVERNGPPSARFLVGTRGTAARVAGARAFVDVINRSGGSAELLDATPYDHEGINTHLGEVGETVVTPTVTRFVRSCDSAG